MRCEGEFLDQVAVEGGQVEVATGGGCDGGAVGAVAEADGLDVGRLAVGEEDAGSSGMLLGPAAAGVRAGNPYVRGAGGRGEPPAGGVEATGYFRPKSLVRGSSLEREGRQQALHFAYGFS